MKAPRLLLAGIILVALASLAQDSGRGLVDHFDTSGVTCEAGLEGYRVYDTALGYEVTCDGDSWTASGGNANIVVATGDTYSPTANEMRGTFHVADNATAANDVDYTLPEISTIGAGASACFYDNGGGAGGIIIDAAAGDEILLDGAGVGVADAIDSPGVAGAGANGDFICIMAIDTTYWVTLGRSGVWVDGGAD